MNKTRFLLQGVPSLVKKQPGCGSRASCGRRCLLSPLCPTGVSPAAQGTLSHYDPASHAPTPSPPTPLLAGLHLPSSGVRSIASNFYLNLTKDIKEIFKTLKK